MIIRTKQNKGFTLVEMIGVLAVIAVLAAMLIPKIFEAVHSSKINNTIQSYNTIKEATADHYTKWGTFADTSGNPLGTTTNFDAGVLLAEGRIDKPFQAKIGDTTTTNAPTVNVTDLGATTLTPATGTTWNLSGTTATNNDVNIATGSKVAYIKIPYVLAADAHALSERLDGLSGGLTTANLTTADTMGRVVYTAPVGGYTTVYLYVAHR
jgi:prepilin-type N-terminal cleavage/methylation domain-containing protein